LQSDKNPVTLGEAQSSSTLYWAYSKVI